MGLKQVELGRAHRLKGAANAGSGGEAARPSDRGVRDRVVRVEGVGVGVGDKRIGRELADLVGDPLKCRPIDLERIVAQVQAAEVRAQVRDGPLGLLVAHALDVIDRLSRLLPQLAGLAALAVGESEHARPAAGTGGHGDRTAGAPDEVGGVRSDHHQPPLVAAGPRSFSAHQGSAPATRLELITAIVRTSCSVKPAASSRSTTIAIPSSTGGLKIWPRSVEITECSGPTARM